MAVAFRNMTTAGGGAATSVVNTAPAGLSDNDILIFVIYKENTNAVTFPSGFVEWFSQNASDSSFRMSVAWKRAASESGSYTASWTGSVWTDGVLVAYSGAITSGDPADATGVSQANGAEAGQISCPSITTATANAMRIAIGEVFIGLSGATPPSGMTERVDFDDTTVAEQLQASAGASGAKVFTTSAVSGQTVGAQIALRENPTASIPFGLRQSGPPVPWHMEL